MSSTTTLPPPIHSYQRSNASSAGAPMKSLKSHHSFPSSAADEHSAATAAADSSASYLSPLAAMHRALIDMKEQAQTMKSSAPSAASAAQQVTSQISLNEFPPLAAVPHSHTPHTHGQCVVHSAAVPAHTTSITSLPHSHPHARPSQCNVSSTCCLPRASFWNLRCSCIFSALPDEILLFNVFSCLPAPELCTFSAVCSRWKFLTTDPLLWRSVDLSKHQKIVEPKAFDSVMSRIGNDVNTLKLCNLKLLSNESLLRLGEVHLANNHGLRSIHFCSIRIIDHSILSALLSGPAASSLRELSLYGCVNVDDACIRLIRRECVKLQDLSVRGCVKITDAAFLEEENEQEESYPEMRSPLAKDTMRIELIEEEPLAQSSSFSSTGSESSLVSDLSPSGSFSPSSFSSGSATPTPKFGRFAHLTSLNVAGCKLLTETGLIAIFRSSPLLKVLNLHGLNPTDMMLDILTAYCPQLTQLHLSSANPFGGNMSLSDAGIEYIAARLSELECLNLQGSSKLTDVSIVALVGGCRKLTKLNLGGCFKLTDAAVTAMCQSRIGLTHLSLFQCVHLTDASLRRLAESMPSLQHLDVHSCAALTDEGMLSLLEIAVQGEIPAVPASLMSLDEVESTPSTSSSSVSHYLLPNLQSIDVGSCRKITKECIARLTATRKEVKITHY